MRKVHQHLMFDVTKNFSFHEKLEIAITAKCLRNLVSYKSKYILKFFLG